MTMAGARIDFSRLEILVVDDEPFMRNLIVRMLRDCGVRGTHVAASAQEARAVLESADVRIDLIVLDLQLPGEGGLEFLAALRASGKGTRATPVLVVSGNTERRHIEEAAGLGIQGYLAKPISRAALETRLVKALTVPRAAAPAGARPEPALPAQRGAPVDLSGLRFLVVDDDGFLRGLMRKMLERFGAAQVGEAAEGRAALAALATAAPDVVLSDLDMPDMDGIELLRHMAGAGFAGAVVLVSGQPERLRSSVGALAAAQNLTVLGTLGKPITPAALATVLEGWRPGARTGRAPPTPPRVDPAELAEAIRSGSITVHFQPKVTVSDGRLVGFEALARWPTPDRGMIMPTSFVPVAEAHGLIGALTGEVIVQALTQGGAWRAAGFATKIAVNLSVLSLSRLDLPEFVVGTAAACGLPAGDVVVEVTETALMADPVKPLEVLNRLRLKGVALSLDDFGTGYATMEMLKQAPFGELKIDRGFVHGAHANTQSCAILESSAFLARKLGMTTVAEGVEDEADWNLVAALGIDVVQGYHVAHPMAADDAFEFWRSRAARA